MLPVVKYGTYRKELALGTPPQRPPRKGCDYRKKGRWPKVIGVVLEEAQETPGEAVLTRKKLRPEGLEQSGRPKF